MFSEPTTTTLISLRSIPCFQFFIFILPSAFTLPGGWLASSTSASLTRAIWTSLSVRNRSRPSGAGVKRVKPSSSTVTWPGRREVEIAAVRPHGVEHAREVPRRPLVRRRLVEAIGLRRRVVRHVAEIPLDAHGRIGHGDADLEPAPDNRRRPVSGRASSTPAGPGPRCIPGRGRVGLNDPAMTESSFTFCCTSSRPASGDDASPGVSSSAAKFEK